MLSTLTYAAEPTKEEMTVEQEPDTRVSRGRYIILQSLVGIMLAYQLLFGVDPLASKATAELIVGGLLLLVAALCFVPLSILQASWFSGALVGIDTLLVTSTIYLSGNARSDLYLAYFILMLIAASLRRFSHVIAVSLLLCTGYGFVLYQGIVQTESLTAGHLLGVPVLLVMATFYGMALETIGVERRQKAHLLESVEELKNTERALQASREQLEVRIKGLKDDLVKANANVRQGQLERQGLERQLSEAQKMEALGRITGGIANEFSHLCSVIGKQTGIVLSSMKPEDPLYAPVEEIFKHGERAAALSAQLSALDQQNKAFRHVLSIKTVIEELSDVIHGLLPDRIHCHVSMASAPLFVEIDREGLEQALLNVVINARDAMPNGGRLGIEVAPGQGGIDGQPAAGKGRQQTVRIQVTDTGSGMTRDQQARMFEPFFSTKETNIGLGLTAVYGIVRQHGGQVDVASQQGKGTRVTITLPVIDARAEDARQAEQGLAARGEETVLLVEPHEVERKLALSVLLRHRYRVLEASSAVEAIMVARQHTGSIQVTVSSLLMPEVNGRDLARQLIKQYPTMKALFVSGYDDEAILSHRINPRYLLRRPYRQQGLVEKVRELMDA